MQCASHAQQLGQAAGVVGVVDEHGGAAVRPALQPAGVVGGGVAEAGQGLRHGRSRQAGGAGHQHRRGDVFDVVAGRTAHRQRHGGEIAQVQRLARLMHHEAAAVCAAGAAAGGTVGGQRRVSVVAREQREAGGRAGVGQGQHVRRGRCHGHQHRVGTVEHQRAADRHGARHHQLGVGDVFQRGHAVFAQVVGADVGDQRRVGPPHCQAAAQDAAARRFKHRQLHGGVAQHGAGAGRAGIVAGVQGLPRHHHAFGAAAAGADACGTRHGGQQQGGGGLAVAAGDEQRRHVVQGRPGHVHGQRQRSARPAAAAAAGAQRHRVVVLEHGHAALPRGGPQSRQRCGVFVERPGAEHLFHPRRPRLHRLQCVHADRSQRSVFVGAALPGPLVDFGGGVEQVFGRGKGQDGRAAMAVRMRLRVRPVQCSAHRPHACGPGTQRGVDTGCRRQRRQHHGRRGEPAVGAGQAA